MNEIQNSPKTPLTFATPAEVVSDIAVDLGFTIAVLTCQPLLLPSIHHRSPVSTH